MKKYKYSAPIMIDSITEKTRKIYLEQCKAANVNRVFFCLVDEEEKLLENFKETIAYFKNNGIDAAIWQGRTIGHGGQLSHEKNLKKQPYTLIRDMEGEYVDAYCPLDENFTDSIAESIKALATTGTKLIMLDDDFRLSQHSSTLCCCCDKHLKKMSEEYGEEVTLEKLKTAFKGGKNKLRDVWLKVQGDSLRNFARKIRKKVDEADESVCVCLATAWAPWGPDGCDGLEITKILAGKNKPVLRLQSAPYWKTWWGGWTLPAVVETEKMMASFCQDGETELMWEGDPYPRPRYMSPASHLELFDAMLRGENSADGILKYMFDYVSSPVYETGYLAHHTYNLPLNEQIANLFANGENLGVRVYSYKNILSDADIPEDINMETLNRILPCVSSLLAENGIPTIYDGKGICPLVIGENARHVPLEELEKGGILDARSALILFERGIDVGLRKILSFKKESFSLEYANEETISINDLFYSQPVRFLQAEYKMGVEILSSVELDEERKPLAWRYENQNGQKFFVFNIDTWDTRQSSSIKINYIRQEQLVSAVEWISGKNLPAKCLKNPNLYIKCAKTDGLVVGLFNCYDDAIIPTVVALDKEYQKVEFYGCSGNLEKNKIILDRPLPAYSYCAFKVFE